MSLAQPADHCGTRYMQMVAPAFFRMADVIRITALSRATLYRRIAEGKFPPPAHLGGRACGWTPTALQAWVDDPAGYLIAIASSQRVPD
ncbi:MAG: AlpA family phage regulatory protein [Glaciimonas sp.]|nr:AlpA family phage regulatory protein [Glaciimonas sp.]